jgi:hypothetical protein
MLTAEQAGRIDFLVHNYRPNSVTEAELAEPLDFAEESPKPTRHWQNQPATQKQANYLRVLGFNGPTTDLTKHEACELIGGLLREAHVG